MSELETQLLKALTGLSAEFDLRSTDLEQQVQDLSSKLDRQNQSLTTLAAALNNLNSRLTELSRH